jgi:FkbM family methyltransferase
MIRRRLAERRRYARFRDWIMSLYNRLLMRSAGKWLPGRGKLVSIYLTEISAPFFLRLGSTDWLVLEEIYFHGEYDAILRQQLSGVRQIVDLGANVGFSVRFWRQHFPDAKVTAVEPDPGNLEVLKRNCGTDPNVQVVQACVAGSARTVQIDRSQGEWAIRMTDKENGGGLAVKALPLTQVLSETGMEGFIDVLKCDIEGAEAEVFADCREWIGRVQSLVLELHPPYTLQRWEKDTQAAGQPMDVICTIKSDPSAYVILAIPSKS